MDKTKKWSGASIDEFEENIKCADRIKETVREYL
jgi:hypothetical protein